VKYQFLLLLLFSGSLASGQITYANAYVDYDSAMVYKNLKIIPVRPKKGFGDPLPGIVSLSQAIRQGLASISERGTASTENVHYLRINNHSDKTVYISSGEIIAGGRQDRMVARDTLLTPTGKDQYISVMCVEEGRWSDKEKKFTYGNFANQQLRKVLDENKNQVLIWQEIARQLGSHQIKNKSLAYLSRNTDKKMMQLNDEYFHFFQDRFRNTDSTIIGFVCVSGNKVIGTDIFGSRDLFYSQLEPLLKGYCDDAVISGSPITLSNEGVKEYMDQLLTSEPEQERFLKLNGKIFRQNGRVIHINSF
jgi:hypothetical protein